MATKTVTLIKYNDNEIWALQGTYELHEAIIVASSQALRTGDTSSANSMLWNYQHLAVEVQDV